MLAFNNARFHTAANWNFIRFIEISSTAFHSSTGVSEEMKKKTIMLHIYTSNLLQEKVMKFALKNIFSPLGLPENINMNNSC